MKSKKFNKKIIRFPFGGHILDPGDDCINQHKIFRNKHNTWIDAGICQNCKQKPVCKTYKEWKRI